ncbi:MAG: hypothetical protein NUW37_19010 [Planctomycetes bacterium]|nr:hypothetical protein [Planctomycetota bacterium]
MANESAPNTQFDFSRRQTAGLVIFVVLCGVPGLELSGFGFGIAFTFEAAMAIAALGGVIGGYLICSRPALAGILGGLIAGPGGLYLLTWYAEGRETIWNLEIVAVQGVGSLPGILISLLIYKLMKDKSQPLEALGDSGGSCCGGHGGGDSSEGSAGGSSD